MKQRNSSNSEVLQEVRQRIQRQAKLASSIEEALGLLESFESIQAYCIAEGGPPEVCATLPDKDLKSFKEIEKFCVEMGAPPELCPTLEVECKKMGITKAEQCFRSLFVSATTAFTSTAPTATQQPTHQRFESFDAVRADCLGNGGEPELCAGIEVECKENGAMTPDECYTYWFTVRGSSQAPSPGEIDNISRGENSETIQYKTNEGVIERRRAELEE
ncbi:MAG: hypothetical protein HQ539_00245 [Parcubacteria group bacterium]|nr:hypothetical protein [Parcubacteria group bacterium]